MYEVINQTLMARRTEERYGPLLGLVDILDEMGYEDSLLAATSLAAAATDADTLLDDIERLILNNSVHLLKRLGIAVYPSIDKEIDFLHGMLNWIISALDEYGDIDEIVDILDTEEPPAIKIAEITTLFTGRDHVDDLNYIENVEPRFIELITNNVTSRKESEMAKLKETTPQDIRVGKFMASLDKDGPVWNEFESGKYQQTQQQFLNDIDIDFESIGFEERINTYAQLIAGIRVAYVEDFSEAIDVDELVSVIVEDLDLGLTMRVTALASSKVLEEYYEVSE